MFLVVWLRLLGESFNLTLPSRAPPDKTAVSHQVQYSENTRVLALADATGVTHSLANSRTLVRVELI